MVVQHLHTVPSKSSTLSITTKIFAALADVVIATDWKSEEGGSIPPGGTKFVVGVSKWKSRLLVAGQPTQM